MVCIDRSSLSLSDSLALCLSCFLSCFHYFWYCWPTLQTIASLNAIGFIREGLEELNSDCNQGGGKRIEDKGWWKLINGGREAAAASKATGDCINALMIFHRPAFRISGYNVHSCRRETHWQHQPRERDETMKLAAPKTLAFIQRRCQSYEILFTFQ